uniref:Putative adhesion-type protein n=1 Tax=Corethrella appendiculata TaxID=1370023 RepID=U5EUX2_9DIPT
MEIHKFLIKYLLIIVCCTNIQTLYGYRYRKQTGSQHKQLPSLTEDNLLIARCHSKCVKNRDVMVNNNFTLKALCEHKCILGYLENSAYKKYGDCPTQPINSIDSICLNACNGIDYKCSGVKKCCPHSCGMSCQMPLNLNIVPDIPQIPINVQIIPGINKHGLLVNIQWDMTEILDDSRIFYPIEIRSHIGLRFTEHKMSEWRTQISINYFEEKFELFRRYSSTAKLRPGRWYQVRVAAVNAQGTQGYSQISRPFQLQRKPKPPRAPNDLVLGPLLLNKNSTYDQEISWKLPKSDMPVEKYRIHWSLFLKSNQSTENSTNNNLSINSLYKETATVSEPKRNYVIHGLLPNSFYYIQIEAISLFGKQRLKSEAKSEIINITMQENSISFKNITSLDNLLLMNQQFNNNNNNNISNISNISNNRHIKIGLKNISVHKPNNVSLSYSYAKNGLIMTMSWNHTTYNNRKFRYRLHLCKGGHECLAKNSMDISNQDIITRKKFYNFPNLKFSTKYSVGFKYIHSKRSTQTFDFIKSFTTPKCEYFRKKSVSGSNGRLINCKSLKKKL